ncbi:hypothetical protein HHI36_019789 [Cryptolaemus montrouzieri]|uniref:Uncharacterized protein n=1 Tax=Cryptolaemus montrouzieri TaxID=559131 RepID=A0ABD2N8U2_9CUCU
MPDEPPVPDHGLGYEIFYGMKQYPENIAQVLQTIRLDIYGVKTEGYLKYLQGCP